MFRRWLQQQRERSEPKPTLRVEGDHAEASDVDLSAALLWAGMRPWAIAALENTRLAQLDRGGDKAIRRIRLLLARAVDELPRLPDFDLPLGYTVGDNVHVELALNSDHPAYAAAEEHRASFASDDRRLLVEQVFNYVSVMPQHGYKLKRRLSGKKPARRGLPPRVRSEVLHRDKYTCQYCGRKAPSVVLEVDHRVPVSEGGSDAPSNLFAACTDCNRGKSNRFSA